MTDGNKPNGQKTAQGENFALAAKMMEEKRSENRKNPRRPEKTKMVLLPDKAKGGQAPAI